MPDAIDFDAYRAEQKKLPLPLTVGGRTYELPPSLPAALAFELIAIKGTLGDDAEMDPATVAKLGADLFGGEDLFKRVLAEGQVTMDELPGLLEMILTAYQGGTKPPNRKTRRERAASPSSPTGRSSSLTS